MLSLSHSNYHLPVFVLDSTTGQPRIAYTHPGPRMRLFFRFEKSYLSNTCSGSEISPSNEPCRLDNLQNRRLPTRLPIYPRQHLDQILDQRPFPKSINLICLSQITIAYDAATSPTKVEVCATQQWMSIGPCSAQFAGCDSLSQQSIETDPSRLRRIFLVQKYHTD